MTALQSVDRMICAAPRATRLLGLAALVACCHVAGAQQSVSQRVVIQVVGHSQATASEIAAPLTVRPTGASVGMGRLTVMTNEANQKVSASLDRSMPAGMALSIAISSSGDATMGTPLDTAGADVVTTVPPSQTTALPLTFELTGSKRAGRGAQRQVVFTIAAGA